MSKRVVRHIVVLLMLGVAAAAVFLFTFIRPLPVETVRMERGRRSRAPA
jgi:hypothetical protein